MNKNAINLAIRAFISIALILLLLYIMRDKYADIIAALKDMRFHLFALAFLAFLSALSLASFRLKLIVEAGGEVRIKLIEAASLTFIGYFFNNFLPTSIGGDVVKGYYLSKKSGKNLKAYTSVFIDRAIGLVTMVFMATGALVLVQGRIVDEKVRYLIYLISAIAISGSVFLMNKNLARRFSFLLVLVRPLEAKLRNAYNAVHSYRQHTSLMVKSVAISVFSQLLFFASIGIIALSIGSAIPVMEILLRMPIISAMSLLPSINGLGVREGSTVLLFGPIMGNDKAFAVSIVWLFVLLVTSLIGGLVYGLSPQFKVKMKDMRAEI